MEATVLEPIADGLHEATFDLRLRGGVWFPCRMTVAELGGGGLALVSPIPIDDALAERLAALGTVTHILAPNLFHHLHAARAKARFPDAKLLGAPGLAAKLPDVRFDGVLGETRDDALAEAFEPILVEGAPVVSEVVFHHPRSKSLVVTDFVFHIDAPKTFMTKLVLRLVGAWGRPAQSRLWRFSTKDRVDASRSVAGILSRDFDRLVMAHGKVVERDARAVLARETAWMHGRKAAARLGEKAGGRALP
jgi:hypothetical protein